MISMMYIAIVQAMCW